MKNFLLVSVVMVFLSASLITFIHIYKNIEETKNIVRKNYESVDFDLDGGRMLSWIDDENVLVNKNNYLASLNLDSKKTKNLFSEKYKSDGSFDCFLSGGGIFNGKAVTNWNNPTALGEFDPAESDGVNHVDCSVRKYNIDMPEEVQFKGEDYLIDSGKGNIFGYEYGVSRSYERSSGGKIRKIIFVKNDKNEKYIDLGFVSADGRSIILSTFDIFRKKYLLYTGDDDAFDINKIWIIDSNLNIIETMEIPQGPWQRVYSFIDDINCFSCGCACYDNANVFMRNGKIYIYVWGKAVKDKHKGVYQLNKDHNGWEKVIDGEFEGNVFFSPDGCKIVFLKDEKMNLMNTCK